MALCIPTAPWSCSAAAWSQLLACHGARLLREAAVPTPLSALHGAGPGQRDPGHAAEQAHAQHAGLARASPLWERESVLAEPWFGPHWRPGEAVGKCFITLTPSPTLPLLHALCEAASGKPAAAASVRVGSRGLWTVSTIKST